MGITRGREQWRRQPERAVDIDWNNPFARGLVAYLPLRNRVTVDTVKSRLWTLTGAPTPTSRASGIGLNFGSSGQYLSTPLTTAIHGAPFAIAFVCTTDTVASNNGLVSIDSTLSPSPTSTGPYLIVQRASATYKVFFGGDYRITTASLASIGQTSHLVLTHDGTVTTLYVDGVSAGSSSSVWGGTAPSTLYVGSGYQVGAQSTLQDFALWTGRTFTAAEVANLYRSQWQFCQAQNAPVYFSTAAPTGFKPAWAVNANAVLQGSLAA